MPKTFKILKYFPDFHYAVDRNKLLYHIVDVIASRIQEIENDMIGILKTHWINEAEDLDTLEKIAAIYGIKREKSEDLEVFRTRTKDIIHLFLNGPGTIPLIFEFIAISLKNYQIEIKKDKDDNIEIIHPVEGNELRSQILIYFGEEEDYLEIHENPRIEKTYRKKKINHGEIWYLKNQGFFNYYPDITIRGYNLRTINPILFNRSTGNAVGFRGVIPKNSVLFIKTNEDGYLELAELDGEDVKNKIFSLQGSQFNKVKFNEKNVKFAIYKPEWAFNEIAFAENLKGDENLPSFMISLPPVPVGKSEWELKIAKSEFDCTRFEEDAFTFPEKIEENFDVNHFDRLEYPADPSAIIEMKWEEHQRAMFEVIIPYKFEKKLIESANIEEQKNQFIGLLQHIKEVVEQVKPAGVKGLVKYRDEV